MKITRMLPAVAFAAGLVSIASAGVTAVNGGAHEWSAAPWSAGLPAAADTAFLNDTADVTIAVGTTALAQGVRIGNNTSATSRLTLAGSTLGVVFVIVGDAANSNAEFVQTGGALTIQNTRLLDFEIGNPQNISTEASAATAVFLGGEASLADVRLNVRPFRETKLGLVGSKARVQAASLSADAGGSESWTVGVLDFVLDESGVAALAITGDLSLGDGRHLDLQVDGRAYKGRAKSIVLLSAAKVNGRFHNIDLKGLPAGAAVSVADGKVTLNLP